MCIGICRDSKREFCCPSPPQFIFSHLQIKEILACVYLSLSIVLPQHCLVFLCVCKKRVKMLFHVGMKRAQQKAVCLKEERISPEGPGQEERI